MKKGENFSERDWLNMIILLMDKNGGRINRDQLLKETELDEEVLDEYISTLGLRGYISFSHTPKGKTKDLNGKWMHIRLTKKGIQRAREFDDV
jgi:hypothetical protein